MLRTGTTGPFRRCSAKPPPEPERRPRAEVRRLRTRAGGFAAFARPCKAGSADQRAHVAAPPRLDLARVPPPAIVTLRFQIGLPPGACRCRGGCVQGQGPRLLDFHTHRLCGCNAALPLALPPPSESLAEPLVPALASQAALGARFDLCRFVQAHLLALAGDQKGGRG